MIVSTKGRYALRVMLYFALHGLPAHKLHCSVLAEEAIKSALKDYYDRNGIEYDKTQFPDCDNCEHCHG